MCSSHCVNIPTPTLRKVREGWGTPSASVPARSKAWATPTDGHNCLAMLVRRRGETLTQLLTRLDLAIAKAFTEDIFTDEINPPSKSF
jgi:hypothetical protein